MIRQIIYCVPCLEIVALSAHFNIQRLTTFQGLLSASPSAEFAQVLLPRHNSLLGFLRTTTELVLQGS